MMTAILETTGSTISPTSNCPTPDKKTFDSIIDALAFAAEHDSINGTNNTPYGCGCGKWHNTTHANDTPQRLKTSSARIDAIAEFWPEAPLRPTVQLTVEFAILTPKVAAFWLKHANTHNRNVRAASTTALAIDVVAGGWELNGDTIRFSAEGVMLDGQHRCTAVATTGVPVPIILVTGLEMSAQQTVDTNTKRTFADTLKLMGVADANNVAALTAAVCVWKAGQFRSASMKPSVKVLLRVYNDHPDLARHVQVARAVRKHVGGAPNSMVALASWLFEPIDAADHADFFEKLTSGTGLGTHDPIWMLREALLRNAAAKAKLPNTDLLAYFVKAWNAYRAGSKIKLLAFKSGGATPEAFPTPR